jgi:DNA-binding transcriptional regulator YiaG
MSLGETIKAIRLELQLTQEQLARDLNVSYTTLNRWERGRSAPSPLAIRTIIAYCREQNLPETVVAPLMKG